MTKQLLLLLLGLAVWPALGQQPTWSLRGRIISAENQFPVEGASISIAGKAGAVSGKDGSFSLTATDSVAVLTISHVGFTSRQVWVNKKTKLPVIIFLTPSSTQLDEVVVNTGFQQLPKERATGSFTQLDNKLLNEQVGTDVFERLKYISNSVVPMADRVGTNAAGQMMIRGLSTLTVAIMKPLVILDNFEYQGELTNINPNDIESVTFLKDAAASSIWGAKAANGVIVVTSKKGKFDQPIRLSINSNVTVTDKPRLSRIPVMGTSDYIDVERYLYQQGYYDINWQYPQYFSVTPVVSLLFQQAEGTISEAEANQQIDALRTLDVRKEYARWMYHRAVSQQYALLLSGGSAKNAWNLSGGLDKNIGELATRYNRYTVKMDNVLRPTKNLEVAAGLYFIQNRNETGRPGYGQVRLKTAELPAYTQFYDAAGTALPLYNDYYDKRYIDTLGGGRLLDWRYYPGEDYKHAKTVADQMDINLTGSVKYRILPFLQADVKYRYEKQATNTHLLYDLESYYARNLINSFSQLDDATGTVQYIVPKGGILDLTNASVVAQNWRGQLDVDKGWNDHQLTAIAGGEVAKTHTQSATNRTYGYDPDVLTYGNVDYTHTYPHLVYGSYDFIPNATSMAAYQRNTVSLYANGAYSYKKRYVLSGSARRDASNLFGVNTNDKWKPLWSVGGSWDVSQEDFYRLDVLPYLKLRVTYGKQGNVDPSKVAATTVGYAGTNPYTQTPYGDVVNFANPSLRWEQTTMFNAGLDFQGKNKRVSGSIEFYRKRMSDLYGPSSVDPTTGLGSTSITRNVGDMEGHGWDVQLNTINIDGKIQWSSNLIVNLYKDKVTRFAPMPQTGTDFVGGGFLGLEGYPAFAYFAYPWAGLSHDKGDPQGWVDHAVSADYSAILYNTKPTDLIYIGRLMPSLFGSLANTLHWKGLSLSARITYKFGYYFRRESIQYNYLVTTGKGHADYAKRWQQPGDEKHTTVPSFVYPVDNLRDQFYSNASVLATRGDHIRLQYVNLSYQFNRPQKAGIPVEFIQLYTVANNLGILWRANKEGLDPDYSLLPPSISFSFGLRVGF